MKCIGCETVIPPAWKAAVASNKCPACGENIYNDETKELIDGLSDALSKMPNDPQGIAGWLLSNYEMKKVGEAEPTEFYGVKPAKKAKNGSHPTKEETGEDAETLLPHERLQTFNKNSGVSSLMARKEEMKKLVEEVQGELEVDGEDETEDEISEEDADFERAAVAIMNKGGKRKVSKQAVEEMAQQMQGVIDENNPELLEQRLKRLQAQKDLSVMGSVGKIRRSE